MAEIHYFICDWCEYQNEHPDSVRSISLPDEEIDLCDGCMKIALSALKHAHNRAINIQLSEVK